MKITCKATNKKTPIQEFSSFIFVIFLALMIRFFVMELFFVPTGSMKATVLEHDYIFATKYSYGYSNYSFPFYPNIFSGRILASPPQRGDIIVFRPPNNMDIRYIKRLIGLPGDKIQLINDVVYINDKAIDRTEVETYTSEQGRNYIKYKEILPNGVNYFSYKLKQDNHLLKNQYGNTEIFYVPEGKYFFLGDNRDESNDSRIYLGFVPFQNFIAKGQFIIFSTKEQLWHSDIGTINQILRVGTWLASIRFNRLFTSLYADKIQE
ncbi:signal peptidase I [Rickettsia endosymbiont of Culicoides newsteadi]|uniref:signal peptidase I n=1 Tax=Rickettsia endosymbiont of Culicoides newsteadi TaxID=1961830 RepID=UPI000B9A27F3|nr:signal peptidase I [Rickettsia endosymbiont of Culicoides newsteadi]OZG32124.1 S26 family signal peptidase [Rickettsia endosymbiont of Culicoides newsteadi]